MKHAILPSSGLKIPIGTLFCIGRNYAEHARELKNDVPKEPVIFLKPASAVIFDGDKITLPTWTQDVHHEVEIVVLMGRGGKNISATNAHEHIAGFGVGIDVTARDVQNQAKEKGLPWTLAKGADTFAPLSAFVPVESIADLDALTLSLTVNGELRQKGVAQEMIFKIPFLVEYLSARFTLSPGDLIFTGTPSGVGPIRAGDQLVATLGEGLVQLNVGVI